WYRLRKYVYRHRLAMAVTLAILGLSTGFAIDRQLHLDALRIEKTRVQLVRDFLTSLFEEARPERSGGRSLTAKELVDRGARRLEDAMPEDPVTRISLLNTLATTYQKLGEETTASSVAARSVAAAQALRTQEPQLFADTLMVSIGIADNLRRHPQ